MQGTGASGSGPALDNDGPPVFFSFPGAHLAGAPSHQPQLSSGGGSGIAHQDLRQQIDNLTRNTVASFLASAPLQATDPAGYALWVHLIQLKTKSLEGEIAEARKREKEAEVELEKLRSASSSALALDTFGGSSATQYEGFGLPMPVQGVSGGMDGMNGSMGLQSFSGYPLDTTTNSFSGPLQGSTGNLQSGQMPFDFDAMLQDGDLGAFLDSMPSTMNPLSLLAAPQSTPRSGYNDSLFPSFDAGDNVFQEPDTLDEPPHPTPAAKRRASSLDSSASSPQVKKTKRSEKKSVLEQSLSCASCGRGTGRMMLRVPKSQSLDSVKAQIQCLACRPVQMPPVALDASLLGTSIGTVETRKRARTAVEQEDEVRPGRSRLFCDVCQRVFASGALSNPSGESVVGMTELVCETCDHKYQRCTDCGGGGGPRLGIGKWRMKQLFQAGRKTCSLNHSRIGDRPREIAVHFTPTDLTDEQMDQILQKCKELWTEKNFSRLAVPDMLEIDLPDNVVNPIQNFADVEALVNRNWPDREAMIKAEGVDRHQFVRILGLTWAHSKPRRTVRTVDLEGEWQRSAEAEKEVQDNSTVLPNVRRTSVAIPAGSELIGMWGGEWDKLNASILVSTFVPFEGTDGEDSTALSVGEMVTKVQYLQQSMNAERIATAKKQGKEPDLLPVPQHLWTMTAGTIPLIRERMADILIRKRSFVRADEYLTRHPDFANAIKARPLGLHPSKLDNTQQPKDRVKPLILARWLGEHFDSARMLEIKQQEFGGKVKLKKRPKARI